MICHTAPQSLGIFAYLCKNFFVLSHQKHDVPVAAIPCLHQIFNLMEVKNEMKSIGECDGPSLAKKARLDYGNQDLQDLTAKDVSNVPNEDSHDLFTHHHTQNLQDESSSSMQFHVN